MANSSFPDSGGNVLEKHPFLPITWAFSVVQTACLILRASNITPRWSVFRRRMERVPSSDAVCFIVACGVFHRRMRRITRPATRCSVGSSMPHRLYDPESHNRGVQQTAGRTACGNGPGKAWFPVWQSEAHRQTERKNMRCKLRVTDKCRNFAIPWMANFFDKRSEQARILSLGMKKKTRFFLSCTRFFVTLQSK